ncbi:MAG TPA: ABC-F family ATP-binding cassette domain-containing protein [Gemmatimonadaceae bacterium]|nr:ABC-F family ATP-binding cassette domain-containing protein [Gemmatimonadaceae bacterium]
MTQVAVGGAGVEFGATTLFTDVTFTISAGERWGVVGRNGTGKTTLFKLLTGDLVPSHGTVSRQNGLTLSLLGQHRDFGAAETVWEAAAGPFAELLALEHSLAEQAHALAEVSDAAALSRYGRDLERFEREGGYTIAPRVDAVLQGLGFDHTAARTQPLEQLSGGERGRVGLARQLVAPSDILLLDEPTNHLDLETTRWLEQYLAESDRTIVLVSHDRAFLAAVIDHVLHFEGGTATPYAASYEAFVQQRQERRLAQQRSFDKQQKVIASESDYIARNLAGQNTKQAKGRRKKLERLPRLSAPIGEDGTMSLRLEIAERGGDQVAVAEHVTVSVPGRTLIERFSGRVMRGDRLGILGPNGAGKSTLLKALVGERPPEAGELRVGNSITVAYYDQQLGQVPLDKTLYDAISDLRPQWERRLVQGHLGRFGFSGDEVQRKASTLSGGERARVALAMMMLMRANLLVLDEPTNHLDVETIEVLEDAIEGYEGTVILVSHDRAMLRALATKVWVLHERHVTEFDGSFAEWEVVSEERAHAASVRASEEVALRRMDEKKRTARREERPASSDARRTLRQAQERAALSERAVAELEQEVTALTATLDDPELYTRSGGVEEAHRLGARLDKLRTRLDAALATWEQETASLESLERATSTTR